MTSKEISIDIDRPFRVLPVEGENGIAMPMTDQDNSKHIGVRVVYAVPADRHEATDDDEKIILVTIGSDGEAFPMSGQRAQAMGIALEAWGRKVSAPLRDLTNVKPMEDQ